MLKKACGKKILIAAVSFGAVAIMQPVITQAKDTIEVPVKVEIKTPIKTKKSMDLDFGKINVIGPAAVAINGNGVDTRFANEAAAKTEAGKHNTTVEEGNAIVDTTKKGNPGVIIVSHGSDDMKFTIEVKYPDADVSLGTGLTLTEVEEHSTATEVDFEDAATAGGSAAAGDIAAIFIGGKLVIEGNVVPKKYSGKIPVELSYR